MWPPARILSENPMVTYSDRLLAAQGRFGARGGESVASQLEAAHGLCARPYAARVTVTLTAAEHGLIGKMLAAAWHPEIQMLLHPPERKAS